MRNNDVISVARVKRPDFILVKSGFLRNGDNY